MQLDDQAERCPVSNAAHLDSVDRRRGGGLRRGGASAEPAPEFGYIVDYRESDGMYRIVFDDIKDAEDANYWYKRGVDWYKRGEDRRPLSFHELHFPISLGPLP